MARKKAESKETKVGDLSLAQLGSLIAQTVAAALNSHKTQENTPVNTETTVEAPQPKKRGRPKKVVEAPTPIVETTEVDDSESEEEILDLTRPPTKKTRANIIDRTNNSGQQRKGTKQARSEPLGKFKNDFVKLGLDKKCQADISIDKKLWGNNQPEERNRASMCKINCNRCGNESIVAMSLVFKNPDDNSWNYICSACTGAKK